MWFLSPHPLPGLYSALAALPWLPPLPGGPPPAIARAPPKPTASAVAVTAVARARRGIRRDFGERSLGSTSLDAICHSLASVALPTLRGTETAAYLKLATRWVVVIPARRFDLHPGARARNQ